MPDFDPACTAWTDQAMAETRNTLDEFIANYRNDRRDFPDGQQQMAWARCAVSCGLFAKQRPDLTGELLALAVHRLTTLEEPK